MKKESDNPQKNTANHLPILELVKNRFKKIDKFLKGRSYIISIIAVIISLWALVNPLFDNEVNFPTERCMPTIYLKNEAKDICNQMMIGEKLPIENLKEFHNRYNQQILNAEIEKFSDSICNVTCTLSFYRQIVETIHTDFSFDTSIKRANGTIEE